MLAILPAQNRPLCNGIARAKFYGKEERHQGKSGSSDSRDKKDPPTETNQKEQRNFKSHDKSEGSTK